MSTTKDHFLALDGLRGVAAVAVLVMHRGRWFYPPGGFIGHGYMAVDFFFLLSGFVIAFAYDERVRAGLGVAGFMRLRLIRLYPLIFLGMLLGAAWPLIRLALHMRGAPGLGDFASDLARGLLLIPDHEAVSPGDSIFPLNGPTWSLFWELAVNLVYVLIGPRLTWKPLVAIFALSAAGMLFVAFHGGIDVGGRPANILAGLPRTGMGFFGGVMLYRAITAARRRGFALPALPAPFLTAAVALVAILCVPNRHQPVFDLVALFLLFPAIVAFAAAPGPAHGHGARLARIAGDISYPLYVLHYPLYVLIGGMVFQLGGVDLPTPWRGLLSAATVIALSWFALKLYDEPLRRRLMQRSKRGVAPAIA